MYPLATAVALVVDAHPAIGPILVLMPVAGDTAPPLIRLHLFAQTFFDVVVQLVLPAQLRRLVAEC